MSAEARLKELGIELPPVPASAGNYLSAVRSGNLLFLSGVGPVMADGSYAKGKVGVNVSVEEAQAHARQVGLVMLAAMRKELGSLDHVVRIVKVFGMVNTTPEFMDHPSVINGCSNLLVEVFGDAGRHARSAVGMQSLPMQIPVGIEAVVEVEV